MQVKQPIRQLLADLKSKRIHLIGQDKKYDNVSDQIENLSGQIAAKEKELSDL